MTTTRQKVVLLMMVLAVAVVLGGCPVRQSVDGAEGAPRTVTIPATWLKFRLFARQQIDRKKTLDFVP